MNPRPQWRQAPSVTGEVKSVRVTFLLAPSVNETLTDLADKGHTSRNDIIERAIIAFSARSPG